MKTTIALLGLVAAFTAYGQSRDLTGDAHSRELTVPGESGRLFGLERPNEIRRGRLTYSGIFVQAIKAKNPLQLINPAAPPEAGSVEQNIARDAITQKPIGLKFFAISF